MPHERHGVSKRHYLFHILPALTTNIASNLRCTIPSWGKSTGHLWFIRPKGLTSNTKEKKLKFCSDCEPRNDTPCLAHTGELLVSFLGYSDKKIPRDIESAWCLYMPCVSASSHITSVVTSGRPDVSSMNWLPSGRPFKPPHFPPSFCLLSRENTHRCQGMHSNNRCYMNIL